MKFKEIEFKYDADDISLQGFKDLVEPLAPNKTMLVSSYDDYFIDLAGNFIRYRYHDSHGELTIKRKTTDKNNNERIEVNLPTQGNNIKSVTAFVDLLGYKHNFGIFKTCQIYWVDNVVLVYYVVCDKELKELRRFIEIEADEEYAWESEDAAWDHVEKYERLLEPLGITSRNRMRKSLFEIFRKDSPKS
jgi:adenylate cyclase class IV